MDYPEISKSNMRNRTAKLHLNRCNFQVKTFFIFSREEPFGCTSKAFLFQALSTACRRVGTTKAVSARRLWRRCAVYEQSVQFNLVFRISASRRAPPRRSPCRHRSVHWRINSTDCLPTIPTHPRRISLLSISCLPRSSKHRR